MVIATKGDVVVGRNSIVGAYSVVTQSCPPYSVLVGNPAKVVKQFDPNCNDWRSMRGSGKDEDFRRDVAVCLGRQDHAQP